MKKRIFILDDDLSFTKELKTFLENLGYQVQFAPTLAEAAKMCFPFSPDIVLLDLQLPDGNGLQFLDFVREKLPNATVVVLSGYGSIPDAVQAIKKGAEDFLTKPIIPDHLQLYLDKIFERKQLKRRMQLQELDTKGIMFVGLSSAMQKLLKTAQTAAQSEAIILISGETGTGKQLLAQFIHQHSPRSQAPFVYVNCATLSETLIESDLFGHEKGAFTGAHQMKQGRVELAHGGTLFLDEISELPLTVQAKLLHFIEYGAYQRVGGTDMLKADVRILCATNKDLENLVQEGKFRQDLFFRINVIQLHIPALRQRSEDILPFVDYFLAKFARDLKKPKLQLTETLKERLLTYPWPGNIRELRNAIERAVILSTGSVLTEQDFPFLQKPPTLGEDHLFQPRPLQQAVNDFKRDFIQTVLNFTAGNQTQAAKILQIQRSYLNRLLHSLKE